VPGSCVDIDLVIGTLTGIGCLRKSQDSESSSSIPPYVSRIIHDWQNTESTELTTSAPYVEEKVVAEDMVVPIESGETIDVMDEEIPGTH
jgi:hypothetical protein